MVFPNKTKAQQIVTLNEALEIANKNYPAIRVAELNVQKTEALKATAYDFGNTRISTGKDEILNGNAGSITKISLEQSDIDLFGIPAKRNLIKAEIQLAEADLNSTKKNLDKEVSKAYFNLIFAEQYVQLYYQIDSIYENFKRAASLRYTTQQTSKLEFISANAKYKQLQILIQKAIKDKNIAKNKLNQYLLLETDFNIDIDQTIDLDFTTSFSIDQNPILEIYDKEINRSKQEWKVEKSAFFPKFDLSYNKQTIDGINGYYGFESGLSIPLVFFSQKSKTKAAKINIQSCEQKYLEIKQEMLFSLNQKRNEYSSLKELIDYYIKEAIPLANEQITASRLAYKLGSIDYIQFIQNIETAINTKQEYLLNKNQLVNTAVEIKYLSGY